MATKEKLSVIQGKKGKYVSIRLSNVRLSFPHLWEAKTFPGQDEKDGKFSASFLFPSNGENATLVQKAMDIMKAELGGKLPPADKLCVRNASDYDYDGYEDGLQVFKASDKSPPLVVDADLTPLRQGSARPYAGCYVNANVTLWAQDNQYGRRVNANLRSVQFVRDGDPFGNGRSLANPEDEFDAIEDSDLL